MLKYAFLGISIFSYLVYFCAVIHKYDTIMKKHLLFILFMLSCIFPSYAEGESLLFSFTTAQDVGKFVYPSIKVRKDCRLRVDAGDGEITDYVITSFASLKTKGANIKFYCDDPQAVESINLSMSKVTEADFSGALGCTSLRLDVNWITAKAMEKVMTTLPKVKEGNLLIKCFTNTNDKNEIYQSHVREARSRGWEVYGYSGHFSRQEIYNGEPDPGSGGSTETPVSVALRSSGAIVMLKVKGNGELAYQVEGTEKQPLNLGANMIYDAADKEISLFGDLTELVCFQSDLTELEIKDAPHLVYLNCCANNLSADAMRTLVASLPDNNDIEKRFIPIDSKNEYEHNAITEEMVTTATTKNWKVLDWNAGVPAPFRIAVPSIVIRTAKQKGDLVEVRLEGNDALSLDLGDGNKIKASSLEPIYELKGNYIHIYGDVTVAEVANVGAEAIDCSQALNLKTLDCSKNFLNEEAFAKLALTLPYRPTAAPGRLIVLHKEHPAEHNKISETNVTDFKGRNWGVWVNVGSEYPDFIEYGGEAIPPKEALALKMTTSLAQGTSITLFVEGITPMWADMGDGKFVSLRSGAGGLFKLEVKGKQIAIYGDLTWFSCQEASIESFELLQAPHLRSLYLNKNKLTSLDLSKAVALEWLNCADNQISGAGMDVLVRSLVDARTRSKKPQCYIVDGTTPGNDNEVTAEQIRIATEERGWELRDFNGGASEKPIYTNLSIMPTASCELYPLPAREVLWVRGGKAFAPVVLYSLFGEPLLEERLDAMGNLQLQVAALPRGAYLLSVGSEVLRLLLE